MYQFDYDFSVYPSIPVLEVILRNPETNKQIEHQAIIDTGADFTLFPERLLLETDLQQVGWINVEGISQTSRELALYSATIAVRDLAVGSLDIIGDPDFDMPIIGRDFLNRFIINLDGFASTTTISR